MTSLESEWSAAQLLPTQNPSISPFPPSRAGHTSPTHQPLVYWAWCHYRIEYPLASLLLLSSQLLVKTYPILAKPRTNSGKFPGEKRGNRRAVWFCKKYHEVVRMPFVHWALCFKWLIAQCPVLLQRNFSHVTNQFSGLVRGIHKAVVYSPVSSLLKKV